MAAPAGPCHTAPLYDMFIRQQKQATEAHTYIKSMIKFTMIQLERAKRMKSFALISFRMNYKSITESTRPDTRLPQSCAGGQRLYLRSLHHLGRSSEAKDRKKTKKVKCDRRTDGRTNGPTDQRTVKAGCRVA